MQIIEITSHRKELAVYLITKMKILKIQIRKFSIILIIINILSLFLVAYSNGEVPSGVPLKDKYGAYAENRLIADYKDTAGIPYYSRILEDYKEKGYKDASESIEIDLKSIKTNNDELVTLNEFQGKENVFIWDKSIDFIEFEVDINQSGLFQIEIEYYMMQDSSNPGIRSILIDGENPFIETSNLYFPRMFKDLHEPIENSIGDEVRPSQVEIPGWRKIRLIDTSGMVTEPFRFYLSKGKHTIRMEYVQQQMAISSIKLVPPDEIPTYDEVRQMYKKNGYTTPAVDTVVFEAESAIAKSDPTLRRETDGNPTVTPRSIVNRKLNTIGGYRWRKGNQSITWSFTVPEDGLYKIGLRVKQSWNDGLPSYRQIAIDGKVPFKELLEYEFPYNTSWNLEILKDENGEPFEFYLTKGTHTISMSVKFGPLTRVIESLNEDNILLSKIVSDIIKITGSDPDPNYDYEFFERIPTLKSDMEILAKSLEWKHHYLNNISNKNTSMAANFLTIKRQLESMIENPFSIAKKMDELDTAQSSLGDWYLSLQSQPLLIDKFLVGPVDAKWKNEKASIFQSLRTTLANFIASFKKDYDNVGSILDESTEIKETIDVWVGRGIEWAEIIKEMADEDFTPKTGIAVNINIFPASQLSAGSVNALMLSIISGRAPDIAMGVDVNTPVEFAIRDAVYDLSNLEEFDEVVSNFLEGIMIPYKYRDGVYAIPETMDFNVMFYRKDIMYELGIPIPETREQLYNYVLPLLYQNGLEFYYSKDFTQILFQHGGEFYTEDGLKSALDSPEAYRAFVEYTEFYTNYSVPSVANFYNRMRTGEMPIGIGNFAIYMQLSVAAPELAGKWGIAPLPGIQRGDIIDRSHGAIAGQADIIIKQKENDKLDEAWEFLKWWSSTPVQLQFAREVEALMGAEARWNTANLEAFKALDWKEADLRVFEEQWKWARETPVVLGGYFTSRHINNAWTSVVMGGEKPRDALENAVKEINRELRMKQEEYGIFVGD